MFEVTVDMDFSAAHNLRGYRGKCESLHGHNWKVRVAVESKKLDQVGMVVDFKIIKEYLRDILDLLDHKYLNQTSYFKKINPTSENIARLIYLKMKERLKKDSLTVGFVTVWETDNSFATYRE
jgi:6-pyruvoyltetrahydropterin/6-carboxytetrahydropterin synthase